MTLLNLKFPKWYINVVPFLCLPLSLFFSFRPACPPTTPVHIYLNRVMMILWFFQSLVLCGSSSRKRKKSLQWICASISPNQIRWICRTSGAGAGGSWRKMRGRSGDSQRPGEEDEEKEGMKKDERDGMSAHAQAHTNKLIKREIVAPTSMSPSLESIDCRPVKAKNQWKPIMKQPNLSLKFLVNKA